MGGAAGRRRGAVSQLGENGLLEAVLDSIIPPDEDPGATDLGVEVYIRVALASDQVEHATAVAAGLAGLERLGFLGLDAAGRTETLVTCAHEPWFRLLAELAAEGFYADPGNGGNAGARSWEMVGYQPRLPSSPDGSR